VGPEYYADGGASGDQQHLVKGRLAIRSADSMTWQLRSRAMNEIRSMLSLALQRYGYRFFPVSTFAGNPER